MELRYYLTLFRRWAWLMVLGVILGVLAGYIVSRYQTPIYQSSTKVLIMQAPENGVSNIYASNDQQLAQTFTELLVTRPVIQGTSERLGYPVSSNQVHIVRVNNAELIQVLVQDSDPQRAADIANTLVKVFLEQNDSLQASRFAASEESLQAQLQQVEKQITDLQSQLTQLSTQSFDSQLQEVTNTIANLQTEIQTLQEEIVGLDYPGAPIESRDLQGKPILITPTPSLGQQRDLAVKRDRLNELQSLRSMYQTIYVNLSFAKDGAGNGKSQNSEQIQAAVALYQQIYSTLLSNYETIRLARLKSTPNIVQVEEALPRNSPIRPNPLNNMTLGSIVGLVLAVVIGFIFEYLDDTFRSAEEVSDVIELPILGYIGEIEASRVKRKAKHEPLMITKPRSPVAEAFRTLRANLEFAELDEPVKTLLVTSAGISEGKTTIAVNLAFVIAQTGKNVALVDADLHFPHIHQTLNLPNRIGLSELLRSNSQVQSVVQTLDHTNISVITSGGLPPDPSELLSSNRMSHILAELKEKFDTIIIDGPPFILADAPVLSSRVDGVLLVIQLNRTHASTALSALEQLKRGRARILGIALNRINKKDIRYYHRNSKKFPADTIDQFGKEDAMPHPIDRPV